MSCSSSKLTHSSSSEPDPSDVSSLNDNEKSIPFLRRLRDMLLENKEIISFCPGLNCEGRKELGRIVVHDRVLIEEKILPRYFNHSSFASLRRQLNYFNFVRDGNGRQRESAYTNESVFTVDDILLLRRRSLPSTVDHRTSEIRGKNKLHSNLLKTTRNQILPKQQRKKIEPPFKRRRHGLEQTSTQDTSIHQEKDNYKIIVSDDKLRDTKLYQALDLKKVEPCADDALLAGCNALLDLKKSYLTLISLNH